MGLGLGIEATNMRPSPEPYPSRPFANRSWNLSSPFLSIEGAVSIVSRPRCSFLIEGAASIFVDWSRRRVVFSSLSPPPPPLRSPFPYRHPPPPLHYRHRRSSTCFRSTPELGSSTYDAKPARREAAWATILSWPAGSSASHWWSSTSLRSGTVLPWWDLDGK
jgi:hypothetical protein